MKRLFVYTLSVALFIAITFGAIGLGVPDALQPWLQARFGIQQNAHPRIDPGFESYAKILTDNDIEVLWIILKTTEDTSKYVSIGIGNSFPLNTEQAVIIDAVFNEMGEKFGLTAIVIWLWNGKPENEWVAVYCSPNGCQIVQEINALVEESWQELMVDTGWVQQ